MAEPDPTAIVAPWEKFSQHKRHCSPIATALMNDPQTRDVGRRIGLCASHLSLWVHLGEERPPEAVLLSARLCNQRFCAFCEWRRVRAWRARLFGGLAAFALEHPTHRPIFLTLTVRNPELERTGETIKHLHDSFKRFRQCAFFPTGFWFRRTELTVERGDASFNKPTRTHPHMHVLLLVPASFYGKNYVKKSEWTAQWQMAARLDYTPVVDVRAAYVYPSATGEGASVGGVAFEAAKYMAKATDLAAMGPKLPELHHQLKGQRMFAVSGPLSAFIKASEPEGEELTDKGSLPADLSAGLKVDVKWNPEAAAYFLTA